MLVYMVGLSLAVGCSTATEKCTNVNQDRIHQTLSASYDQTDNSTSVSAQLRFGDGTGTTLSFTGSCAVTHSIYSLSESVLSGLFGTSYTGSGSGLQAAHTFVFTDGDGKKFTNSGTITSIASRALPAKSAKPPGQPFPFRGGAWAPTKRLGPILNRPPPPGAPPRPNPPVPPRRHRGLLR